MRQKLLFLCILSLSACSGEPAVVQMPPTHASAPQPSVHAPPPLAPGDEVVQHALAAVGVSYRRGGESPDAGFDCSGLIVHVYREALGLSLPHNARAQSDAGHSIDKRHLAPGDLVFYNTRARPFSHVGIYLGDGRFVHAPKPGATVRIERMASSYWNQRYEGARRIAAPATALPLPTAER
jgi:cell wall-associated NlpC family hydrolase